MTQFGRNVMVRVGAPGELYRELPSVQEDGSAGFSILARVRRSQESKDDEAEVSVRNPGPRVLEVLQGRNGLQTELLAGYGSQRPLLLSGRMVRGSLRIERRDGTKTASWQVSDGGVATRSTRVSRAWSSVNGEEVLDYLIDESGLARGSITFGRPIQYVYGYVLSGSVSRGLAAIARDTSSRYTIHAGRLDMWPADGQRQVRVLRFAADSGLVDSPVPRDKGKLEIMTLLAPSMRVGDRYTVHSDQYKGDYIAEDIIHTIDSGFGPAYNTTIVGRRA